MISQISAFDQFHREVWPAIDLAGIVDLHIRTYNQHDKLVFEGERTVLMKRRSAWGVR